MLRLIALVCSAGAVLVLCAFGFGCASEPAQTPAGSPGPAFESDRVSFTPLERHGWSLCIREGCYTCHGPADAGESRLSATSAGSAPALWPAAVAGRDKAWHVRHLIEPRPTSPNALMPSYAFLVDARMQSAGSDIEAAQVDAEARRFSQALSQAGVTVFWNSEIVPLVAYVRRLGPRRLSR
ncbi:MAG: hypothetical protein ACI9MR_002568, partial [Myxococcota bacterium]